MTELPNTEKKTAVRTSFLRSFIRWLLIGVVSLWTLAALILLSARWIDPPTTAVHTQRRMQAWTHHTPYRERYKFVPLSQISPDLQHAVVAAEDSTSTSTTDSTGTKSKSPPKTTSKASARAALPPSRSNW